ncbi:MAG: M50 family metallopeptidase [Hyphomicrobium sp.]
MDMQALGADLMERVMFALPFLVVLTVVVFVHELGHFLVARWCGVKVKTFSIGFGHEIFGFDDRHGTRWRLAWIPLGGYVKFMDDENAASAHSRDALDRMSAEDKAGSFHAKPVWQRAAVVAAGPIANFILAIVIFALWFSIFGMQVTEARVDEVVAGGPASEAGFKAGDRIVAIDGTPIDGFEGVQQFVTTSVGRALKVEVERGGGRETLEVTPRLVDHKDENGQITQMVGIGVRHLPSPDTVRRIQPGPGEALWLGVKQTNFIITSTLGWVRDVIRGHHTLNQLGGPARIADIAGKVAKRSKIDVIYLIGVISVSVGLINLFPIPLLDGGHLMFYAIEAVRRRPLSEASQEIGFRIGFALVLTLMILATFNDLPILKRWFVGAG